MQTRKAAPAALELQAFFQVILLPQKTKIFLPCSPNSSFDRSFLGGRCTTTTARTRATVIDEVSDNKQMIHPIITDQVFFGSG